jgi:hypothetical protein
MSEREGQTASSRQDEEMDEAHSEPGGHAKNPEPGHPVPGEGVGLPEEGPGRANEEASPRIGTEDQGATTED